MFVDMVVGLFADMVVGLFVDRAVVELFVEQLHFALLIVADYCCYLMEVYKEYYQMILQILLMFLNLGKKIWVLIF